MKNPVLDRLQRYGIRPRKELGQHFLMDQNILSSICRLVDAQPGDTVLEYGPGIGVLTEQLLGSGARVVGIELDEEMAAVLRGELSGYENFRLLHTDLAHLDTIKLIEELGVERIKLVGNLPYQLTSQVLFGVLELGAYVHSAVFMVQREVAERIVVAPGSRQYGILSVLLNTFHTVQLELRVKPGSFVPPPRVDSAVLRIVPRAELLLPWEERQALIYLVKSVFNERRKVLRNTLKKFFELDAGSLESIAEVSGLDLGRRPETLSAEDFVRLLHAIPAASSYGSEN